jgi:hypothetical protein
MKVRRLQSPQPQNKSHLLDPKLHTTENTMICTDGNLDPGWDRHENMMNWIVELDCSVYLTINLVSFFPQNKFYVKFTLPFSHDFIYSIYKFHSNSC